jgi:hypothetical protein
LIYRINVSFAGVIGSAPIAYARMVPLMMDYLNYAYLAITNAGRVRIFSINALPVPETGWLKLNAAALTVLLKTIFNSIAPTAIIIVWHAWITVKIVKHAAEIELKLLFAYVRMVTMMI